MTNNRVALWRVGNVLANNHTVKNNKQMLSIRQIQSAWLAKGLPAEGTALLHRANDYKAKSVWIQVGRECYRAALSRVWPCSVRL